MSGWLHGVSLFNLRKNKRPFRVPPRDRGWRFLFWLGPFLYLSLWSATVYNNTGGFQAFLTWRSLKLSQQRRGFHIENVYLTRDPLQSAERRLKTTVLYSGEKQKLSPHQTHFWGEHTQILWSRLLLFPSLIFFLSVSITIFGPYLRKQRTPAFTPDMAGPSELRAPGSSFGTSLGPVNNFPHSSSQITSPQHPSLQKQGYDFSFCLCFS